MPNNSIKDEKLYNRLLEDGNSPEKSARISNAIAKEGSKTIGKRGGSAPNLDDRTVKELQQRAKELGLTGYSRLKKSDLIQFIRNH